MPYRLPVNRNALRGSIFWTAAMGVDDPRRLGKDQGVKIRKVEVTTA